MGCIHNVKIHDKKFTSVITSNKMNNEVNERKSQMTIEHIYSKKQILNFEDTPQTNIYQNLEDLIENNPLPFVKIKRSKKNL